MREKLSDRDQTARASLNRFERLLMDVTRHELDGDAEFRSDSAFWLERSPFPGDIPVGLYELPRRSGEAHLYRLNHPLGEAVVGRARERDLPPGSIRFDISQHEGRISILEPLVGRSGWLSVECLRVEALDRVEEHLIHAAVCDDGSVLDEEQAARMFSVPGERTDEAQMPDHVRDVLARQVSERSARIRAAIEARNLRFFQDEVTKLEGWADDLKLGLERDLKELDRQIREARRASTSALTLEEKLAHQKQVKLLEAQRREKRRSLFDAQDAVDQQRDDLIAAIEQRLGQEVRCQPVFLLRWVVR